MFLGSHVLMVLSSQDLGLHVKYMPKSYGSRNEIIEKVCSFDFQIFKGWNKKYKQKKNQITTATTTTNKEEKRKKNSP